MCGSSRSVPRARVCVAGPNGCVCDCVVCCRRVGGVAHLHLLMHVCSIALVAVAVCSCAVNVAFVVLNVVTAWRSATIAGERLANAAVWVVCIVVSVATFACPSSRDYCAYPSACDVLGTMRASLNYRAKKSLNATHVLSAVRFFAIP